IITPVVEILESVSLSPSACVLSAKSRLPAPTVTGKIHRCIRSMRWCLSRVWIRFPLPCIHKSGLSSSLSFLICATTSPLIHLELCHEGSNGLFETTYFLVLLNGFATTWSSFVCGQ